MTLPLELKNETVDASRLDELLDAADGLVNKMRRIENSNEYRAIWESAFAHGVKYQGEQWSDERDRLGKLVTKARGKDK
jgi:hypothetical protein